MKTDYRALISTFARTLTACLLCALFSCGPQATPSAETAQNILPADTLYNVSYGPDSLQTFDIYLPANRSADSTKVIVLVHGGGWRGCDKSESMPQFHAHIKDFPGYAIVNMNYRLSNAESPALPKQMEDMAALLKEIGKAAYNLSTDVCLTGASSGGHLVLLYAYAYDTAQQVKAVCVGSAPLDMSDPVFRSANWDCDAVVTLLGAEKAEDKNAVQQASPLTFVRTGLPPTLAVSGDKDSLIPVAQLIRLDSALKANNVPCEIVVYEGENHGDWTYEHAVDYLDRFKAFVEKYF